MENANPNVVARNVFISFCIAVFGFGLASYLMAF